METVPSIRCLAGGTLLRQTRLSAEEQTSMTATVLRNTQSGHSEYSVTIQIEVLIRAKFPSKWRDDAIAV